MNPGQIDEEAVFDVASRIESRGLRAEYVEQCCGDNAQLLARVHALLEVRDNEPEFLEAAPSEFTATWGLPSIAEGPGDTIGKYKLVEQIGEGGMGVVYAAEQQHPMRRKVALKIVKPGMDTKEVIARFEAERQAFALMTHSHIAQVLDAGSTDSGRPYFVMEFVSGAPITEYCDRCKLTTRQRLELFASVCQAVQHAHQKGIIHRDIKPSNVMVSLQDGAAEPKIIDFGIAKAINRRLTENTLHTECGRIIGTPLYMSPEQAHRDGPDVDTRTDIYSLGVLLYELLTGATPFERTKLENVSYDEIRRIIRDEEPLRPSTKIDTLGAAATTVCACRRTDSKRLSAALRRDLDWIVMKALEKDRDRRYKTADGFATDIRRYLNDQVVEACPPSTTYKFFKFARRHQRPLFTAAALAAMLAAGAAVSAWQAIRATESERIAKAEAAASEAVIAFINGDLLAQADPSQEPDRDLRVRDALDRASLKIDGRFDGQPLIEAAIRHAVGTAYLTLGEYVESERHLERAVDIRRRHLGAEHRKTIDSLSHLAITICRQGRCIEAERLHRDVLKLEQQTRGSEHPRALASMMNLAAAVNGQGRYAEAEKLTRELLRIQQQVLGAEHPDTLKSMLNLANAKRIRGRLAEAEQLCRKLIQLQRRVLPAEHPQTLDAMSMLANVALAQGRHAEAESLHQEVYDIRRRVLGPEHPGALSSMNNLSLAIYERGRHDDAEKLRRELLEIQQRVLGLGHPATLESRMHLANIVTARRDFAEAEKLHQEVFDAHRQTLGAEHPDTLVSKLNLLNAIMAQGRHSEAERGYRDLLQVQTRVSGLEDPNTLKTMMNLAVAIHKQGRYDQAETLRREILSAQTRALGPEHPDTLASMFNLANAVYAQDRYKEAEQQYRTTLQKMRQILGEEHRYTLRCMTALAYSLDAQGHRIEAEEGFRQVLGIQRRVLGPDHPETIQSISELAWLLSVSAPPDRRDPAQAVELAQEALRRLPDNGKLHQVLAQAQYRAGHLREAVESLHKSREICGPNEHDALTLALVLWRLNKKDLALALYDRVRGRPSRNKRHETLRKELESLVGPEAAKLQS